MSAPAPTWIDWARRLQAMAQNGLTYARDDYDTARYRAIAEIALEMMAAQSGSAIEVVRDLFAGASGHATPKLDVRTAVFRADRVLLVREKSDGLWTLPGGWADAGESPSEAAAREVVEEAGYEVRITRLLALYDKRKHPHPPQPFFVYKLFFAGEILSEGRPDGRETDAVAFFPLAELPRLSLDRVLPAQIHRLFQLHTDSGLPPDFD